MQTAFSPRAFFLLLLVGLIAGCAATQPPPVAPAPVAAVNAADVPPPAPREFRGVWVATVANIDWPSKPGLPTAQQRAEMLAILDRAQALRLNAIVLQVRPAADAIYPSSLEPWSEFLTGKQGRAPEPLNDPLREWIAAAHGRGLELHAWFNPYRARHQRSISELDPSHLAKTHPGVVKTYGELMWMDPGEPVAQKRTLDVVREVVRNYDLDGVHLDDYFYPYPIADLAATRAPAAANAAALTNPGAAPAAKNLEFPDEPSWQRYLATGGKLSRADWRRQNVNQLVEALDRGIHELKPHVRFGISPFGIGRPDRRPAGISGFSQYDQLFADVELWVERGWMDYLTPQLYWPRAQKAQAFEVLLDYWARENPKKRHLWPGLYTSQVSAEPKPWEVAEITGQIELLRTRPAATGHVHFSMVPLLKNSRGLNDALAAGPYANAALVPATPWLDSTPPPAPALAVNAAANPGVPAILVITPGAGEAAANFAIWLRYGDDQWRFSVQPAGAPSFALVADAKLGAPDRVVVTAVDRLGNESARVALPLVSPGAPAAQR
jgi:uncharacterized lipoprotein YddW (UPF0748 family)